ncbi:MAG: rRNA maturation RNase YbeY [Actinobacteria bacterium]|nr:rRNA maturation RNase YbeY [Actinomycetota bacterium]
MGDEPPEPGPTVVVVDERAAPGAGPEVDADRWGRLASDVLVAERLAEPRMELTVHFVDEQAIADLRAEHLDGDGSPTDVLAFPLDNPVDDPAEVPDDEPVLLGDVVICPAVAARQAVDDDGVYVDEVALLLVHGILHLLGHDHAEPDDKAVMQQRESELLDRHHRP